MDGSQRALWQISSWARLKKFTEWNVEVHEKCILKFSICLEIYFFSLKKNHHHIFIFNDPIIVIVIIALSVGRIGHLRANSSISDSACPPAVHQYPEPSQLPMDYTQQSTEPHCTQSIVETSRPPECTKWISRCTKIEYKSTPKVYQSVSS